MDIIYLQHILPLLILTVTYLPVFLSIDESWDLDGPCQEYVQNLAKRQSQFSHCAVTHSVPPKVCTNCFGDYIDFKQAEYMTHHLDNALSVDNKTCSSVIYSNYQVSYANELSLALTNSIWDHSRCSSCLKIVWDFEKMNSTIAYDEKTIKFENVLNSWRSCVTNYSLSSDQKNSTICVECGKEFDLLFDFYWKIYTSPDVDFCIDVETTMNDTMALWHNVWVCPDDSRNVDRHHDVTIVIFSATLLVVVIGLFYAGSYVQTESAQRNLIQYSRMETPRGGTRFRLLSSSTNLDSHAAHLTTPSSSVHINE